MRSAASPATGKQVMRGSRGETTMSDEPASPRSTWSSESNREADLGAAFQQGIPALSARH